MTKSRGILPPRHRWTDAEIALLRAAYPDQRAEDIASRLWPGCTLPQIYSMAKRLELEKSDAFLASAASGRLDGERGTDTRFKRGQKPPAGCTEAMVEAGKPTRFKQGTTPHNHVPVGTEVERLGYTWVKVAEPNQWKQKHLLVWKDAHGEFPAKGMKLCFRDGNRLNTAIENLECITQAELTRRNSIHRYPPELREVIRLAAKVRRKIDERAEEPHQ